MSWHFLQEVGEGCCRVCCTDGVPLPPLRSKTMHAGFCSSGKLTESYLSSLSGMTYAPSTESRGEEKSTSSAGVFRVQISVPQEKAQGSKGSSQDSGAKWRGLSMKFDPPTFTLRTAHSLFSEVLELSCVTLPKWGMLRGGELWARMTSPPLTAVKGSGYWPTPTKDAAEPRNKRYEQGGTSPATAVNTWPTPVARDANPPGQDSRKDHQMQLANQVKNWPTPVKRDHHAQGANHNVRAHSSSLATVVKKEQTWPTPTAAEADKIPATANYGQVGLNNHPAIRGVPDREKLKKDRAGFDGGQTLYWTPCASEYADCGSTWDALKKIDKGGRIQRQMASRGTDETKETANAQLAPGWVEWLMGWPVGWTALAPMTAAHFENWKRLTIEGEWFHIDPAECVREDVSPDGDIIPRVSRGVKHRAARLKCIGNGQVPVCACVAFNILKDE